MQKGHSHLQANQRILKKMLFKTVIAIIIGYFTFMIVSEISASAGCFRFTKVYVDRNYGGNGKPGWVRAGDMDRDGDLDIVGGGGYALFIYENDGKARTWKRHGNLDGTNRMGANGGVLHDVDKDGDLDVISAQYNGDLGWWENPGSPLVNVSWKFHSFCEENFFLHDLVRADLNFDGRAEEFIANLNKGYWKARIKIRWFKPRDNPAKRWDAHSVESGRNESSAHGHAGLDVGDIDQDGELDIAYSNGWYESRGNARGEWRWHEVTDTYGISNTLLRDMDNDGDLDLIMSAGHHGKGVYWFENPKGPKSVNWTKHVIDGSIEHPEGLAVRDLDEDGDLDVVAAELDFKRWSKEVHSVYVFENLKNGEKWKKHSIASKAFASHQLQVEDINGDGRLDIISEGCGHSVVSYYENVSTKSPKRQTLEKE